MLLFMMDHPHIPCSSGPTLYPAMMLINWLRDLADDATTVQLQDLPFGNAALPDLLRSSQVNNITVPAHEQLPTAFRWESAGGHSVLVTSEDAPSTQSRGAFHHGDLPATLRQAPSTSSHLAGLLDLARLEDATGVMNGGTGAAWDSIMGMLEQDVAKRMPPLTGTISSVNERFQAWNPLPFARHCLLRMPITDERPPWGFVDHRGHRSPVQVIEENGKKQLLTTVELGALECVEIDVWDEPVPGPHWTVDQSVIDNGLVRAELDALGQVKRLSFHHNFVAITAPFCQIRVNDRMWAGDDIQCEVRESGPVRSSVVVTHIGDEGTFTITYSLYAYEDFLRVDAQWEPTGDASCSLDHPTGYRRAPLRCAGDFAPWVVEQTASVCAQRGLPQAGCRWATLDESNAQSSSTHMVQSSTVGGVAVASGRNLLLRAENGHLHIAVNNHIDYALSPPTRSQLSFGALTQHLRFPGRVSNARTRRAPALRIADQTNLNPIWIRPAEGWKAEFIICEQSGLRGKAWIFPTEISESSEAWITDVKGNPLRQLPRSKEGDGFELTYQPHEFFIIRWK